MERLEEALQITVKYARIYALTVPKHIEWGDLLHEAIVRVLRYLPSYDPSQGELETYLNQHVKGAIKDYLRSANGLTGGRSDGRFQPLLSLTIYDDDSEAKGRIIEIPDPSNGIFDGVNRVESTSLIKAISSSLPYRLWQVLLLYYWGERKFKEIGEFLGVGESRASQLHNEALNQISGELYSRGIKRLGQLI